MERHLPQWILDWLSVIVPIGQTVLIVLAAWLLQRLVRRLVRRLAARHGLPDELVVGGCRISAFLIYGAALLLVLERAGVSATVLWTAFTGFAAVGAVAFFAAWSVLSNVFCALLIFTSRPFRLHDHIEILENGEKPGLKGQVVDINLVYTTLRESADRPGSLLQVPNNLFFQRVVRRSRDGFPHPAAASTTPGAATAPAATGVIDTAIPPERT